MINLTAPRQAHLNWIATFIGALWLAGCVGDPVASYKTKTQKFSWGKMHAWMSREAGTRYDATEGSGYLLLNLSYKKSVMEKGCTLSFTRVYLKDPDTGVVLVDSAASLKKSAPMIREIGEYNSGQLSLDKFPFAYTQSSFPYNLSLDVSFNCEGKQTSDTFSKQIKFSMVQPVAWEQ
ncbi:MAG: hypothetical protein V3U57_02510 [Robiginitomaculum sp.]